MTAVIAGAGTADEAKKVILACQESVPPVPDTTACRNSILAAVNYYSDGGSEAQAVNIVIIGCSGTDFCAASGVPCPPPLLQPCAPGETGKDVLSLGLTCIDPADVISDCPSGMTGKKILKHSEACVDPGTLIGPCPSGTEGEKVLGSTATCVDRNLIGDCAEGETGIMINGNSRTCFAGGALDDLLSAVINEVPAKTYDEQCSQDLPSYGQNLEVCAEAYANIAKGDDVDCTENEGPKLNASDTCIVMTSWGGGNSVYLAGLAEITGSHGEDSCDWDVNAGGCNTAANPMVSYAWRPAIGVNHNQDIHKTHTLATGYLSDQPVPVISAQADATAIYSP